MTSHTIELENNVTIHYMEYNLVCCNNDTAAVDKQITLLLLHGSCQTLHTYDDFIDQLQVCAQNLPFHMRIINVDLRGHGDSSHCDKYDLELFAQDVLLLIERLNLENLVFLGMSLGGLVTMKALFQLFEQNSTRVARKAIVVDITPDVINKGATDVRRSVQQAPVMKSFDDWLHWAQTLNPNRSLDNLKQRLSHSLRLLDNNLYTWKYDVKYTMPTSDAGADQMWKELESIRDKVEFLLVVGGNSAVTSDEGRRRFGELANGRVSIIENAGHSVQGDQPEAFTQVVLQHLSCL